MLCTDLLITLLLLWRLEDTSGLLPPPRICRLRVHAQSAALQGTKTFGSKGKSEVFFCSECGTEHVQWVGRCSSCREWNTVKPFRAARDEGNLPPMDIRARAAAIKASSASPSPASLAALPKAVGSGFSQRSISQQPKQVRSFPGSLVSASSLIPMQSVDLDVTRQTFPFYSGEVNRVLGGGLVRGSVILLAGEPGVGKSTLMLQLASSLVTWGGKNSAPSATLTPGQQVVVYVSGEENAEQIAARAKRLGLETVNIFLICDIDTDEIVDTILGMPTPPIMLIVDSIQTMRTHSISGSMGSITQTRECAARFVQLAKATGSAVLLSGHVTKTGEVAGPRVLEHMVDTILYLEGSERAEYRLLRGMKNRYGSTSEVGVLAMKSTGLVDVANPSELFLSDGVLEKGQDGSAVAVIMEGSRPLLAEIQCLVSTQAPQAKFNTKRMSDGFPIQRLLLILAIIEKRLHLPLWSRDVYVNVAGGLRISEPSCDLAVAITVISSMTGTKVRPGTVLIGELGLGGEIRGGRGLDARVSEARKVRSIKANTCRPSMQLYAFASMIYTHTPIDAFIHTIHTYALL